MFIHPFKIVEQYIQIVSIIWVLNYLDCLDCPVVVKVDRRYSYKYIYELINFHSIEYIEPTDIGSNNIVWDCGYEILRLGD